MNICLKRREAPIAYTIDWGRGWIGAAEIRSSRWSVEPGGGELPAGSTVAVSDTAALDGVTRATISGGVPDARYTVRGHVELSDGRTGTRALALQIGGGR